MRRPLIAALVTAGLLAGTAVAAPPSNSQQRLAKLLEGRVAGKPVDCIQQRSIQSAQIVDGTAIVYDVGRIRYVNRPRSGANFLDRDDILVTDTHSSQLCSVDIVRLVDSTSRMPNGSIGLGAFVPYTKPRS